MAIQINSAELGAFRNVDFGNADAIANLDGEAGGVRQNGALGNFIGKMFRSAGTKEANNAVRTELLKSLGRAFGLGGVTEANGRVTFSKDFMDGLEKILGPAFKRADFGVGADGTVKSGKPLTERRIKAIVDAATLKAADTEFDTGVYSKKLDFITNALAAAKAKAPKDQKGMFESAEAHFAAVKNVLDFIDKDLDFLIRDNYAYDPERPDDAPKYVTKIYMNEDDEKNRNLVDRPLESIGMVANRIYKQIGIPLHIQENVLRNGKIASFSDLRDPQEEITDYVKSVMTEFVQSSIDLYFESEVAGIGEKFLREIGDRKVCLEAKTEALRNFQGVHLSENPIASHDSSMSLDKCIGLEIGALAKNNPNAVDTWQKCSAAVKERLVGTVRPITVARADETTGEVKFEQLLDSKGKPVVRAVTAEDIDNLGEAVLEVILFG